VTGSAPSVQRSHFVRDASPAEVFAVVSDFEAYPRFFSEFTGARLLEKAGKRVRVEFRLQVVLPVRYVLDLVCDPDALTIDWTFVEGEIVTNSEGGWRFKLEEQGTRLDYRVSLTIKAPLPGFMVRKVTDALVAASLPAMFSAIEREVAARKGGAPLRSPR
jgi:ribosome-associated toxin RatA of RatAB toxin-antitoxin module